MTTSPRRRRTSSEQVSAAVLHAAETVLDRDGTAGVTIRAVAREAAVAPMSVYNRFANKEALLAALAMRTLDDLDVAIETRDGDPVERFRQACRNYRTYALAHPARYGLIFSNGSPLEGQNTPAAAHGQPVFAVLVDLVRAFATEAAAVNPTESAQSVWSAVHGAVTIEIARIGQTPNPAASFEHLLDLLVAGLA
ncbi:TetR/AcrR family transcriptional regulator [Mycobacterium sp. DL592]|uniref:TetR/AcrR family transcriptional regulator n=1 Tax=Mycobacterium sp. DL592 TaxID=2675524 RepID=UPI00142051EA|nr:TetR-like C-terminal domain-containing protein [Mycobacterium sp. DL592]